MQRLSRRRFPSDFKAQAVVLAESVGRAKAARPLDMSVKTLGNWLDASRAGRSLSWPSRSPVTDLESALARRRAGNATLKMEREILPSARPRRVRARRACAHAVGHKRVARWRRAEGLRGRPRAAPCPGPPTAGIAGREPARSPVRRGQPGAGLGGFIP
ncbi:transposase [Xanthomonas theicola]|uniref:transposase n=1 Tax=Xanthomonas theicola TaxID=56464 RepID=UPI0031B5BA37